MTLRKYTGAPQPLTPPVPVVVSPPQSPTLPTPATPRPPMPAPGSVTQLLREFEPLAKSPAPVFRRKKRSRPRQLHPESALQPIALAFARLRCGIRAAPDFNSGSVGGRSNPPADPIPANFLDKNFPAENTPPKESPKAGEFTSFFQGPFRGDRLQKLLIFLHRPSLRKSPLAISPPCSARSSRKLQSRFPHLESPETSPRAPDSPVGLTRTFPRGLQARDLAPIRTWCRARFPVSMPASFPSPTPNPTAPPSGLQRAAEPAPIFPEPMREPFASPPPASYGASASNLPRATPPLHRCRTRPPPSSIPPNGATRAFSRPAIPEAAPAPPPPSGPSAYTQVISLRPPHPAADSSGADKDAPKSITPPAFTAPPMPPLPKLTPPPCRPAPAAPKFAAPTLPPPPRLRK